MPALPYTEPELLSDVREVPSALEHLDARSLLLVTGPNIYTRGLTADLEKALAEANIACTVFSNTHPDPTVEDVEAALNLYHEKDCAAIIGFGGGSPIDCAKGVAARVAQPKKSLDKMQGLIRVHRPTPPIIAIPTTAGTGSEATLAAVVVDSQTRHKFVIDDFVLIPRYAVLDWRLTKSLPAPTTATTGMDALTHAVEAYIGRCTTAYTRECCEKAVTLIHESLLDAWRDGSNENARADMQRAAYLAGVAFTRSYVGYVHGIAHSLGGQYGVSHGLAVAVILPHVLRAYGTACHASLARLARVSGVAEKGMDDATAADAFIDWIDDMNATMGIPGYLTCIRAEDIPQMARYAAAEANPLYPVPVLWDASELEPLYGVIAGWDGPANGTADGAAGETAGGKTSGAAGGTADGAAGEATRGTNA